MKRVKTTVLAGFALALAGGAWAQDVKIDYDKAANFSGIKTFSLKLGTPGGIRSARSASPTRSRRH